MRAALTFRIWLHEYMLHIAFAWDCQCIKERSWSLYDLITEHSYCKGFRVMSASVAPDKLDKYCEHISQHVQLQYHPDLSFLSNSSNGNFFATVTALWLDASLAIFNDIQSIRGVSQFTVAVRAMVSLSPRFIQPQQRIQSLIWVLF